MAQITVSVGRRARIAMDALSPEERERVEGAIRSLQGGEATGAKRISAADDLFLLRASPTIRLIYRQERPDRADIIDVLPRETLQWYRAHTPGDAGAPADVPAAR